MHVNNENENELFIKNSTTLHYKFDMNRVCITCVIRLLQSMNPFSQNPPLIIDPLKSEMMIFIH